EVLRAVGIPVAEDQLLPRQIRVVRAADLPLVHVGREVDPREIARIANAVAVGVLLDVAGRVVRRVGTVVVAADGLVRHAGIVRPVPVAVGNTVVVVVGVAGIPRAVELGVALVLVGQGRAVVAGIADAVTVRVGLGRVRRQRAVVTDIAHPVAVLVELVGVSDQPAVVVAGRRCSTGA